jgi:hypothetical protein
MTPLIWALPVIAYLVLGLVITRLTWTRMDGLPEGESDLENMANTFTFGLAFLCWPLALLIAGCVWFVTSGSRVRQGDRSGRDESR